MELPQGPTETIIVPPSKENKLDLPSKFQVKYKWPSIYKNEAFYDYLEELFQGAGYEVSGYGDDGKGNYHMSFRLTEQKSHIDAIRDILQRCREDHLPVDIYTRQDGVFRGYVAEVPEEDTGVVRLRSQQRGSGSCILVNGIICVISQVRKPGYHDVGQFYRE